MIEAPDATVPLPGSSMKSRSRCRRGQEGAEQPQRRGAGRPPGHLVGLDELLAPAHRRRVGGSSRLLGLLAAMVGLLPALLVVAGGVGGSAVARLRRGALAGLHRLTVQPSGAVRRTHQRAGQDAGEADLSASAASSTNSSGLTQRSTGWWRGEGRRYWVIVISSQPGLVQVAQRLARPPRGSRPCRGSGWTW